MKKQTLLCFALTAVVLFASAAFLPSNEAEIYDQVVRLHILANSDSERDQELKLLVRDAVTARSEEIFGTYDAIDDVLADMPAVQDKLCAVARETLDANGCDLPVTAAWGRESYPTREYEGISFPAGSYYSLRLQIGEAAGQNWFCVLFPPLCLSASTAHEALQATTLTENAIHVFLETNKPKYVFRFKLLEWFGW